MTKTFNRALAVLLFAATLLLSAVPLAPLTHADTGATSGCTQQISQAAAYHQTTFDQQAAIAVAQSNSRFSQYQQYNPVFSSIFDNWSFDASCNVTLEHVSVVFQITNSSKTEMVVVQENPQADEVTSISVQNHGSASWNYNHTNTFWSGYEFGANSGATTPIYDAYGAWSVPSISQPNPPSGACPSNGLDDCILLVWTGLDHSTFGGTGIAQTGTDSDLECPSGPPCSTGGVYTYSLWYEFWPQQSSLVSCASTSPGDSIETYVDNQAQWGGNPNYWDLQVADITSGQACTISSYSDSGIGTPYLAAFILERENLGFLYSTLPQFGSVAYTATMNTGGSSGSYTSGWYNLFVMQNGSPAQTNIATSAVNSANTFTSTWQTSYGT